MKDKQHKKHKNHSKKHSKKKHVPPKTMNKLKQLASKLTIPPQSTPKRKKAQVPTTQYFILFETLWLNKAQLDEFVPNERRDFAPRRGKRPTLYSTFKTMKKASRDIQAKKGKKNADEHIKLAL